VFYRIEGINVKTHVLELAVVMVISGVVVLVVICK